MMAILIIPPKFRGRLFKLGEDSSEVFEPSNHALHNVPFPIRVSVKLDASRVSIFVFFGRDHRCD